MFHCLGVQDFLGCLVFWTIFTKLYYCVLTVLVPCGLDPVGSSIKDVGNLEGEGVKFHWNLLMDGSKNKMQTLLRRVSKNRKKGSTSFIDGLLGYFEVPLSSPFISFKKWPTKALSVTLHGIIPYFAHAKNSARVYTNYLDVKVSPYVFKRN